ncbi:MAG: LacI family transcriptional regulator [Melioribacteraceae bacterium]|nr:LacI family transcriptional regulator [Melioribacteraceae bacterium]MCF8356536.1 LacI family transcriptional regulator [Melioribacteraceae bacterium]MCF8393274.1 LacI family transcriptional regulator [Melioribacteraceae bacterium]MCF8417575.1 LacI family transcriptional regulator [Melioribacteraceae bacterium]
MKTTIKDIAEKANVSFATVSRALNNHPRISSATKEKITKIADELNYKPNFNARSLVKKETKIIGLVLPEIQGDFFTEVIKGIDQVAHSGGYHVIVASSHSERSIAESIMSFMGESMVDGVILMIPAISDQLKEIIGVSGSTPVVIINGNHEIEDFDIVYIDNFQGAYSIIDYIIKNYNYTKIAHIKGPLKNNDALERFEGFKAALQDNGLELPDEWIINGDFNIKGGEIACSRLLSLRNKPEVIFAGNDMMAAGCYRAIKTYGLSIPGDIGVVGFDHTFLSELISPPLTTVHIPIFEVGKKAASLLLEKLKNKDHQPNQIKISTGIILGESCRKKLVGKSA